ncbi:MAG TPA: hypothetical protein VFZ65_13180 [Planctomycetota bacterium]|nr:hypothetical protein [Planctomycetota bacterium]
MPRETTPSDLLGGVEHTYSISVVEKETGLPAANAEVLYLPAPVSLEHLGFAERVHARRMVANSEEYLRRYGAAARCDANGRVRLTLTQDNKWFLASKGNLRGELDVFEALPFASDTSEHRIELEDPLRLDVQVVDAEGRPQPGVELDVSFGDTANGAVYYADNPDAVVSITKPLWANDGEDDWRMLRISPAIFGADPEALVVDMLDHPAGPVRIVCPPTGRLLVTAPGGVAAAACYRNRLILARAADALPAREYYDRGQLGIGEDLPDGRFLFPFVALDQQFVPVPIGPSTLDRFPPAPPAGSRSRSSSARA